MDLKEKIQEIKENIKAYLLLGKFEIYPLFNGSYDLSIENSIVINVVLNHFTKDVLYDRNNFQIPFFDISLLSSNERKQIYTFVINGGIKLMLRQKLDLIEILKKEVGSIEAMMINTPDTEIINKD
jgi:hypothetical protein